MFETHRDSKVMVYFARPVLGLAVSAILQLAAGSELSPLRGWLVGQAYKDS